MIGEKETKVEDCWQNNRKRFLEELQGFANFLVTLEESYEMLIKSWKYFQEGKTESNSAKSFGNTLAQMSVKF